MNMFKSTPAKTPEEYIDLLPEPHKSEIQKIHEFIKKSAPKLKPYIQTGVIGYGEMHYKSKSGREGEWFVIGLAQQKNYVSIYLCAAQDGEYVAEKNKDKLGKASIGRSCIRYKKFEDIPFKDLAPILKKTQDLAMKNGLFT